MYSHMWLPIQMEHERETIFSLYTPHNNHISLPLHAGPPKHTDSTKERSIERGCGVTDFCCPSGHLTNDIYSRDQVMQS